MRTARIKSPEGLNAQWLWDNLKMNTKVLVWDDRGRKMEYPDDNLTLYYNPEGGQYYHSDANCSSVRDKYLPLTGFPYAELDSGDYADLTPCSTCTTIKRKSVIDAENLARDAITVEEFNDLAASRGEETLPVEETADEPSGDVDEEPASTGVQITIRSND